MLIIYFDYKFIQFWRISIKNLLNILLYGVNHIYLHHIFEQITIRIIPL